MGAHCPEFKDELEKRRRIIDRALKETLSAESHPVLGKAMSHYPSAGGKRLRPILAMLVADAISESGKRTIPFGCAVELIHNFTLVHDDIMDNDTFRRGIRTVHTAFDIPTAIIAGDALFSLAFEVVSTVQVDEKSLRALLRDTAEAVRIIAEGQQMDMEFERRTDVTEQEYLEMIGKKTACLFSLSTKGGALIAGGTGTQIRKASEYGYFLGMGFQIKDDILGIQGDERVVGKPVGSDIRNGKKTLIAVKGLGFMKGASRTRFTEIFGRKNAEDAEIAEAKALLEESGAVKHAQDAALEFSHKAKSCLDTFEESNQRMILEKFADFVISRDV